MLIKLMIWGVILKTTKQQESIADLLENCPPSGLTRVIHMDMGLSV